MDEAKLKLWMENQQEINNGLQAQLADMLEMLKNHEKRIKELEGNDVMNAFKSI